LRDFRRVGWPWLAAGSAMVLGLALLFLAWPGGNGDGAPPGTLAYELDLRQTDEEVISVRVRVNPATSGTVSLRWMEDESVVLEGFEVLDRVGRPLPFLADGHAVELERVPEDGFVVRYRARPGGAGRHGRQGYIDSRFAVFDGRVLILPRSPSSYSHIRFTFLTPDDWHAFAPYRPDGRNAFSVQAAPLRNAQVLRKTCMGAGPFEVTRRQLGRTEVSVHTFGEWPAEERSEISDETLDLYEYFHDRFGFQPAPRFNMVWTPRASDRSKVLGGVSAISHCSELPSTRLRHYEVLAHRIAHAINRYPPSGMNVGASRDDTWFGEGWATYQEIVATHGAGLIADQRRWNAFYEYYVNDITVNPQWDAALIYEDELSHRGREHLHYRKSPIVMKTLEYHLRERGVELQEFISEAYGDFGHGREFPFKENLEARTGMSLEGFWNRHVRAPGILVPVWQEYITPAVRARMDEEPVLEVGGERVHADYVFYLGRHGAFDGFSEIVEYLEEAAKRRAGGGPSLAKLYPGFLNRHRFALPPATQFQMDRLEVREREAGRSDPARPLEAGEEGLGISVFSLD